MGFLDFIGDAISSVTDVITKPIGAIASAVSGGASKTLAPVTKIAGKALDNVLCVAKAGIQTTGQTFAGISTGVDKAVSESRVPHNCF